MTLVSVPPPVPAGAPDSPRGDALSFPPTARAEPRFFVARRKPPEVLERMARGEVRIAVTLACETCKRRNYQTNKNRRNDPDRIEMRKFCRWCGRHTAHKETR